MFMYTPRKLVNDDISLCLIQYQGFIPLPNLCVIYDSLYSSPIIMFLFGKPNKGYSSPTQQLEAA
jgi:hypothetical protein